MQSLTRYVERRLMETPLLPTLAVFLAGMLALIITFAVLALLAACGWDCLSSLSLGTSTTALAVFSVPRRSKYSSPPRSTQVGPPKGTALW